MRQRSAFFRVYLAVATLTVAVAAVAAEAEAAKDPTVLQRLLEAQRSVTTMTGRFTQSTVRVDEPTEVLTTYQGHVDLQAPDQYNLVYTKPNDDEYRLRHCSDGKKRWQIEVLGIGIAPDIIEKPVAGAGGAGGDGGAAAGGGGEDTDVVRRIAALLRGDREAVLKDFTVQAAAVDGGFTLVMTPKPGAVAERLVKVEADLDAAGHVQALRFFDHQGNRVTITVSEAVYNQPIAPETFTYATP